MTEDQEFAVRNYMDRGTERVIWPETEYPSPDPNESLYTLVTIESPFPSNFDQPRWCCRVEFGSGGVRYVMDAWSTAIRLAATKLAHEALSGVGAEELGRLEDDIHGAVGLRLYKSLKHEELALLVGRPGGRL